MKSAQDYLAEANAVVPKIETHAGIAKHGQSGVVFVDVRDSAAIQESGTIAGALRIPRGFIEFAADQATQFHNPQMDKDAEIILVCGAGGQAALAGRTLVEMGFKHVSNVGGFGAWKDEGGPVEV
ncbi:MAG: rhodanese [SAR116 cluster bacterium]|nr:rhodanese [SAR116 cluster bacterium]OUV03877.1 MAG: rhodanese [bacterium TMED80]RPG93183.1 MAG: rhodanese-like domain-containing protein [Candidatus Puniceispirillum sp. TMED213]